jgi:hypothetical protein
MNLIRRFAVSLAERGTTVARRGLDAAEKLESSHRPPSKEGKSSRLTRRPRRGFRGYLVSSLFLSVLANLVMHHNWEAHYVVADWIATTVVIFAVNGLLLWHSASSRKGR